MKPPGIRCLCVVQFSACLFPDKFFDLAIESLVYKKRKMPSGIKSTINRECSINHRMIFLSLLVPSSDAEAKNVLS